MRSVHMWRCGITLVLALTTQGCASDREVVPVRSAAAEPANTAVPLWHEQFVLWPTPLRESAPWRSDGRLQGIAAPGYPDDVPVLFPNPDSAQGAPHELMWVKVIAHDVATDRFLGILLSGPQTLASLQAQDNVVFRYDEQIGYGVAIGGPGGYGAAGWPRSEAPAFQAQLVEGIRAYRQGNFGHNMPGIEHCIEVLSPIVQSAPPEASREGRFLAHFVLGRCLAESYETEAAMEQFQAAIRMDPQDVHAQMALLAELSVMAHKPASELRSGDEQFWEQAFLDQLALVKNRYSGVESIRQIIALPFDPALADDLPGLSAAELAKRRRVGFAVIRWKER